METCTFGEHLTLDGYGGSFNYLNDAERVGKCLLDLPRLLVMRPLAGPTVRWAEPNDAKDPGGWSGYVLIAESHISVHTFPHRRFLSADVYTCREGTDTARVVLGRAGLPIESVRRIGCDGSRLILVEDEHGEPLSVGRKSRVVPQAIKRVLWTRDEGCRFPGCGRRRFVDAHHIEHWSAGGETSLANLMLLCSKHHTLGARGRLPH